MKSFACWSSTGAAVALLLCAGGVRAATTNPGNVMRVYTYVVAPAQRAAYEAGDKSLNQCLSQHGFKYAWQAWTPETGDTSAYIYTSPLLTWANLDTLRAEESVCDSVWLADVTPHVRSESSYFLVLNPGFSHLPKNTSTEPLLDVFKITLKPGMAARTAFTNAVKAIYAAQNKANWDVYSLMYEVVAGGQGAADYILLSPKKSWADFGTKPNPSLQKLLANVYGKKKADKIWKSATAAIANTSEFVIHHDADLTYTPSAQ